MSINRTAIARGAMLAKLIDARQRKQTGSVLIDKPNRQQRREAARQAKKDQRDGLTT